MPKIKEFQEILRKKNIDFFLAANVDFSRFDYDMAYFSGYNGVGVLVIPKNKTPFLIVSGMEAKRAMGGGLKVYSPGKGKRLSEAAKEKIKQNKIKWKKIGVNKEEFSLFLKDTFKKALKGARFAELRNELYKLREQKTKEEIKIIKKGCGISDGILGKCFKEFKKFRTEADVKAFLEYEAKKKGCEIAFPTIVASGKNSSEPHHDTEDIKLKKGFCVIDFGIRHKNYCTDTTRTVYIGGPSKKEKELYDLLLGVQKKIIESVKLNEKGSKLFEMTNKELGKYSKNFNHGLGHGFGIKVHESPNLTEKSKDSIKEGSVFTVEPGVYFERYGIRIEDDVLFSNGKTEVLTKAPKSLLIMH